MNKKREPSVGPPRKFVVRMPDGFREQLSDKAKRGHRSLNAEILLRIASGLDQPVHDSAPTLDQTDLRPSDGKRMENTSLLRPHIDLLPTAI
ncbi:Arc family DNA-binding protein [Pseudomonas syringae]|uniref:Arc family DNA-binding protein n=1 Tax=Pseudomonas syringae TaxID=317 RepID=UPI0009ABE0E5